MTQKAETYMLRATLVSLFCNIVLVLIKSTAFIVVGSLAIAVDLGISFVGLSVSIILYYSMKMANRPADLMHNYGYGKVEHVCEALEGVVLIGIALAMSSQAILNIFHPREIDSPIIGLLSCSINVVINFGGAYYIFKMAKKSGSPAIYAEGIHYRMEGFISAMIGTSFIVVMALIANHKFVVAPYVDPATALLVSLFLIIPSFKLAKGSFFKLLDASIGEDSQMQILKPLSRHINEYCEFYDIRTRSAGRKKFVELKIIVPEGMSLKKSHSIATMVEDDIKHGIDNCEVLVKVKPCGKDCEYMKNGEDCPYL